MAKNYTLAIIIQGILWGLFVYFCFLFFLKGVEYARKYCALMLVIQSFYFHQGHFCMHGTESLTS